LMICWMQRDFLMNSCVHIAGMEENKCLRQDVLRTSELLQKP
jgi:hypothetical protein